MGTSLLLAFPKSGVTSTFVVELWCGQPVIIYVSNNFGNFPPKEPKCGPWSHSPSVDQGLLYLSLQPLRQTFFKFFNAQLFGCREYLDRYFGWQMFP